jgi:transposase InsO family protein
MCSPTGSSVGDQDTPQAPASYFMLWINASQKCRPYQYKLVHYLDCGSQYLLIKYIERLAKAKIASSVGSVADSYENALAKTINGLFKAEVIHRRGPWRNYEAVECHA